MQHIDIQINNTISSILQQHINQKEEIEKLRQELESQKKYYVSELHHPLRYYSRLLRKKYKDLIKKHLEKVGHQAKEENKKQIIRTGACERLYQLWKSPYENCNPTKAALHLTSENVQITSPTQEKIDVIIPIYNGINHLRRLMPTLFENTTQNHRFIFIDDYSPDSEVKKYISEMIANRNDCLFIENTHNIGFPGTVNLASKYVESPYFVILNTDVMVPKKWLERMIKPFIDDSSICTTTPFTNAGGVFYSFPNFCDDYHLTDESEMLYWDNLFQRIIVTDKTQLEFINGTGYCMGIRKACWDKFGGFDAKTFERGYGEETDLCLRYLDKGWKNVLVPNLFVYHNHGGSFPSEEKKALTTAHLNIIKQRWGKYIELIQYFVAADPWAAFRLAVLQEKYCNQTDYLIFDLNDSNGGACKFRMQQEQLLLATGKNVVSILYSQTFPTKWTLTFVNADGRASFPLQSWEQAEEWIKALSPKEVIINNLAFNHEFKYVLDFMLGKSHKILSPYNATAVPSHIIDSEHPIEVSVNIEAKQLEDITFVFATYCRKNETDIILSMYAEDGTEVFCSKTSATKMDDNAAYCFPVKIDNQHCNKTIKKIRVASPNGTSENSVSIYLQNNTPCLSYTLKKQNKTSSQIKFSYCFHDFFSCCPSFFLLNSDNMFCNYKDCHQCLPHNKQKILPFSDIDNWRTTWAPFLSACSHFRFFSQNTYELVSKIYQLPKDKILIKGHDALAKFKTKYLPPKKDCPLHIGVVGAWYESKGSKQVLELATLLYFIAPEVKIYFYGIMDNPTEKEKIRKFLPNIIWAGKYNIEDLPELFTKDTISVVFFSSVYPETFSFVTQECIDIGIPIVCFNIGASGDRVRDYDKGYIVEDFSSISVYKKILEARNEQIKILEQ